MMLLKRLCGWTTNKPDPFELSLEDRLDVQDMGRIGLLAENLLEDPLLKVVFASMIDVYRNVWENSAPDQAEQRHQAYLAIRVVRDVRIQLRGHLERILDKERQRELVETVNRAPNRLARKPRAAV